MRITVYVDEDIPLSFSEAILNRGVDAVTTQEAGNKGLSDADQLVHAAAKGRVIITHNKKDFILLHNEYIRSGKAHAGIIVADQLPVGVLLRRFMKLWFSAKGSDMKSRLVFLGEWQ